MKNMSFFVRASLYMLFLGFLMSACQKELDRDTVLTEGLGDIETSEFATLNAKSVLTPETPFTVMSFNLRNPVATDPFDQLTRLGKLTTILSNHNVDILGVQELANNTSEAYVNSTLDAAGYDVYKSGPANGSPKSIYYKRARFERIKAGNFLKQFAPSIISSAKWVILRDILYDKKYFVINSHWYHTADAGPYRQAFATMLVDTIKAKREGLPVICMGDFNAIPGTTEIGIIKDGSGLNMVDALMDHDGEATFHKWTGTGTKKLDYIMSTRDLSFRTYKVVKDKFTVNGSTMWPSDHFPVLASYLPAILGPTKTDATSPSTSSATQYYFADVDGDGQKDRVKWTPSANSGRVSVYLSTGNGAFSTTAVTHTASATTSTLSHFYLADVNGDGKADLIHWNRSLNSGKTQVYLASSGGQFSSTVINNSEGYSAGVNTRYHFADVNGDGKADKMYWNPTFDSGNIRLYLATSNGYFVSTVNSISNVGSSSSATTYYFADINGDGKEDLIKWNPSENSGKTMVYLANSSNGFTASSSYSNSGATSVLATTSFYFADINGDGKADKVYYNPTKYLGEPKIYFATSSAFSGPYYSLRGTSASSNTLFYFADINGDGKADQIRWNRGQYSGAIRTYRVR